MLNWPLLVFLTINLAGWQKGDRSENGPMALYIFSYSTHSNCQFLEKIIVLYFRWDSVASVPGSFFRGVSLGPRLGKVANRNYIEWAPDPFDPYTSIGQIWSHTK